MNNLFNIKNIVLILIIFVLCVILFIYFKPTNIDNKFNSYNSNQRPFIISLYGDSLMSGFLLKESEHLSKELHLQLNKQKIPNKIMNSSIAGNTTSEGLQRINSIINDQPDIVILCLGANDMLQGINIDLINKNLEKIIIKLQKHDIKIILAGMYASPILGNDYATKYKDMYVNLSQQYNLIFMPFILEGIIFNNQYLLPDKSHPNFEGVKIMAKNLLKYLAIIL
ncbi:GDSL-type esterase/lipase family protein [Alphaproteobacteria bacterium]|nr:GDSL-type esterase/lipase family protein [Alphaproteobacteria bacterium]